MTQGFQKFTKGYVNVLGVLIGLAVVSSILLYSGCGMTSSPNTPANPTPTPDTTPPISTITSPTAGVIVPIGKPVAITGTASDAGGGSVVRVEVSVDGGANFSAATGTNAWSFNWTPSAPGPATIKSRAVDNAGNQQNPPAEIRVTVDAPPTSTIASPTEGATVLIGTQVAITGTASDAGGLVVRVEVSVDGGVIFIPATGTNAWSFNWTPSAAGPATIKSRAVDNTGNVQNPPAEIQVTVDAPPTSTITSPTAGAIVPIGKPVAITGTASDPGGGSVVKVEVSVDGGATFSDATGTNAWSFDWTPSAAGPATIKSRAVDNTGNVQNPPAEIRVTVDAPPTSTITSPTEGATVLVGTQVTITGTAIDAGSVVKVEVSVDGGATFSAATGRNSWSFNWTPSALGQATIKSRAVDNTGNVQNPPAEIHVTVDARPTSTITFPKAGATVLVGTQGAITGTASDTSGGSVVKVEVSVDGATFSAATGTNAWSFDWTPTTPGLATIRSRATDNDGNVQDPPAQITVTIGVGGVWTAQGPGPTLNGQVENIIPNNEVVGAIHTVAAHPTDPNILYVGGVNSGIWKTNNATAASPNWTPLTDTFPSLSIGALEFDPTDASHRTLIAGIGRFSSFNRNGGPLTGILRTTDGGDNWTQISPQLPVNISGVAARGATLLAAANMQSIIIPSGLFRSIDGGNNWVSVSGSNGLPTGGVFDLVGDPSNLNRFYVSVRRIGIFRSNDGGATWTNISSGDTTLNGIITQTGNNNAEMAVASNGRLYVVVTVSGRAQYIGFSDNPTAATPAWTAMDLPRTLEADGQIEGINPGGQGSIHLSIAVDRNDPNTVYVAGDRQDFPFPNFIGARDFSGRLFRGDTTVAPTGAVPSPQWEHLTHLNSIPQIPGGGTASGSSPHADSRDMAFDANGDLIEVNDGGIYRRTSPQNNTGDWFSINGDIQTTEFHDVAYDTVSNTIILGGAQDTGTPQQTTMGSTTWSSVSTADGGDVAVDNLTLAAQNQSIRYSSFQNLIGFRRQTYNAANNLISSVTIARTLVGGGDSLLPTFVTPVELNAINPTRLVISGSNSVYESFNQGDTITQISGPGSNQFQNAMAYGGRSGGVDNPDILYVGSGVAVFVRTTAGAPLSPTAALPAGAGTVRDVVIDPDDWRIAYAIDSNQVFRTADAGVTWTEITGNLTALGAGDFGTTEFVAGGSKDLLLVGTNAGVFVSFSDSGFASWIKLGTGLPNARVSDLDYDVADDVLLAGALGRGAWTLTNLRDLTMMTQQTTPAYALPAGHKR